jgi:Flp pilus assembly protein TadG
LRGGRRGGGAIVEALLVLPLMVMLSLGAGEYGYAFYLKHSLQAAAGVGVRTAILATSTDSAVQSVVAQQLALTGMQNIPYTLTTVPASVTNCTKGTFVSLTISCTWGSAGVSPLPNYLGGISATKQFSASASMVHE